MPSSLGGDFLGKHTNLGNTYTQCTTYVSMYTCVFVSHSCAHSLHICSDPLYQLDDITCLSFCLTYILLMLFSRVTFLKYQEQFLLLFFPTTTHVLFLFSFLSMCTIHNNCVCLGEISTYFCCLRLTSKGQPWVKPSFPMEFIHVYMLQESMSACAINRIFLKPAWQITLLLS